MRNFIFFSLLAFVLSFGFVLAQEQPSIGVSVSSVEIKDIQTSVDEKAATISGSFTIKNNSEKAIPDLGWRVYLKEKEKPVGGVIYINPMLEYVMGEEFSSLAKGAERSVSFSLKYSPLLSSGEYSLIAQAMDRAGHFYASGFYTLNISAEGNLIIFDENKCSVKREDGVVFKLGEGGNVDPGSKIILSCEVQSKFRDSRTFKVKLTASEQSIVDYPNTKIEEKNLPDIILNPGLNKLNFNITAAPEPQSYQNIIRLYNEKDQAVSDFLLFRYVVRGESAVIKNLSSDKDYYQKGDSAKVSFSYFGSADLFWRGTLPVENKAKQESGTSLEGALAKAVINDSKGEICGESTLSLPKIDSAFNEYKGDTLVPIKQNCLNPKVSLSLVSKDQKELASYEIGVLSSEKSLLPVGKTSAKTLKIIVVGFIVLAIIALAAFLKRRTGAAQLVFLIGILGLAASLIFAADSLKNAQAEGDGATYIRVRSADPSQPPFIDRTDTLSGFSIGGISSPLPLISGQPANYQVGGGFSIVNNSCQNAPYDAFVVTINPFIVNGNGAIVYQQSYNNPMAVFVTSAGYGATAYVNFGSVPLNFPALDLPPNLAPYQLGFGVRFAISYVEDGPSFPVREADKYQADAFGHGVGIHAGMYYNYHSSKWGPGTDFYQKSIVNAYCHDYTLSNCPSVGVAGGIQPPIRILWPISVSYQLPTLSFSANPSTITLGQSSTLSWSSQNTSSCSASGAWSGGKATAGSEGVSPSTTSTYTFSCSGSGGSVSQSATVNVNIPAPTLSFSTNPSQIIQGQSSTLSWSSQNANSCGIQGVGGVNTSGSTSVSPSSNTTYTLNCSGPGGSASQSQTITVIPVPTLSFSANPTQIVQDQSTTLSWSSSNASSCSASGAWSGSKAASGSQAITIASPGSKTYVLTCSGPGGNVARSVTVNATAKPKVEEI